MINGYVGCVSYARCTLPLLLTNHKPQTLSLSQESLSSRDITQLLSLFGALGASPSDGDDFVTTASGRTHATSHTEITTHDDDDDEDSHDAEHIMMPTRLQVGRQAPRVHDSSSIAFGNLKSSSRTMKKSRASGTRKKWGNQDSKAPHVRPQRPLSAPARKSDRETGIGGAQWNSDARTDYSRVCSRSTISQLNVPVAGSSDDDDNDEGAMTAPAKIGATKLSHKRASQLTDRLHFDAERRVNERKKMASKRDDKELKLRPELSSATKRMTEGLAPFKERQETHMLRKQERMVRLLLIAVTRTEIPNLVPDDVRRSVESLWCLCLSPRSIHRIQVLVADSGAHLNSPSPSFVALDAFSFVVILCALVNHHHPPHPHSSSTRKSGVQQHAEKRKSCRPYRAFHHGRRCSIGRWTTSWSGTSAKMNRIA